MNPSSEIKKYISQFDMTVQERLENLRTFIQDFVPEAQEKMAYGMVAFHFSGKPLVYFGGFKNHIGLYALPTSHQVFADKLSSYKQGKGSVQFPHTQELPMLIIQELIEFRIEEIISLKK